MKVDLCCVLHLVVDNQPYDQHKKADNQQADMCCRQPDFMAENVQRNISMYHKVDFIAHNFTFLCQKFWYKYTCESEDSESQPASSKTIR